MDAVINVKGLKRYFSDVKAVDEISLNVEKGELFGFLGVNGAGKSTTINMLCTLLKPTAGTAQICGLELGKENDEIRRKIGVVYQRNCLDDKLTVKENLFVRGSLYEKNGTKLKENVFQVCEKLELSDVYSRRFEKLSGGQKRRCEIARALINTPELMFLDEPTTGLDPSTRKKVWECMSRLRKEDNMTIFLTTHYMEEAAKASHIAVIDNGVLKQYGTPFGLKEQYAKDKLRLIPKNGCEKKLENELVELQCTYKKKEEYFVINLADSMLSFPILKKVSEMIRGYEMLQGSMDDVFLNITGKALDQ
ncbi:MAG TPA: ATP-binding cassette domain-containing protein [Lachnospiraceae bacterium]|nr:ATP-binding cassette domain-containing protein [Lachnospiraceae bacterium]